MSEFVFICVKSRDYFIKTCSLITYMCCYNSGIINSSSRTQTCPYPWILRIWDMLSVNGSMPWAFTLGLTLLQRLIHPRWPLTTADEPWSEQFFPRRRGNSRSFEENIFRIYFIEMKLHVDHFVKNMKDTFDVYYR